MRYPRYRHFDADRMLELLANKQRAAAQNASAQEDEIEQLRRNLGGCNDPDERVVKDRWQMQEEKYDAKNERPLPYDYQSDYAPEKEDDDERDSN